MCGHKLGLGAILLPGIKGGDERILCRHCGSYISSSMRHYNWIGLLGLPFGILVGKIPGYFGLTCGIWCTALTTVACIFAFAVVAYYQMPLRRP